MIRKDISQYGEYCDECYKDNNVEVFIILDYTICLCNDCRRKLIKELIENE